MEWVIKYMDFLTKFFLNNTPEDMAVQDLTDYNSTGETTADFVHPIINISQVEIVIDAFLPNGNIFYDGDDSFVSPDIDRSATDIIVGIPITKDLNGNLLKGTYKIDYKLKVTDERLDIISSSATQLTTSLLQLRANGDFVDFVNDNTLLVIPSGNVADTYTLSSISYNSATNETIIQLIPGSISIPANPDASTIEVTSTRIYTISKDLQYNYTASYGLIVLTSDCDKSELRSEDKTDYSQYDLSAPLSGQRNHLLRYPIDLVPPLADVPSQNAIISINPIYTNVFTSSIAAVVELTTGALVIQDTINATESFDVQCGAQWCAIFSCVENVAKNYDTAISSGNQSEIQRWEQAYDKIQGYYMLWRIARSCGDNEKAAFYFNKAVETASSVDCCSQDADQPLSEPSKIIQAISDGGLTTIYNQLVNQWFSGAGVPSAGLGDNDDLYINTIAKPNPGNGDIYLKITGVWVVQTNISGDDGLNGTNGTDGLDGSAGLRGSQIFSESSLPADGTGLTGDFNIRADSTIDKKTDDTTLYWEPYSDPNGTDGTQIFKEVGIPSVGIGVDGDYSIDATSSIIYLKTAGVWALHTDPSGADGTGMLYVNAVLDTVVIADPNKNVWQTWAGKGYTLPAGILSLGDTLKFTMDFYALQAVPNGPSKVRFEFPGHQLSHTLITGQDSIKLTFFMTWRGGFDWSMHGELSSMFQDNFILSTLVPSTEYKFVISTPIVNDHTVDPITFDWNYRDDSGPGSGQTFNTGIFRVELIKA